MEAIACTYCRGGRCATHALKRLVPHSGPKPVADEAMVAVGCCDRFENDLKRRRVVVEWRWCPWCGAKRT